jgi:DNA-binding response OmpR family regulator
MSPAVLIVEDYADLRLCLTETLVRHAYTCDSASSVDEALRMLATRDYEVILLAPTIPIKDDRIVRFIEEQRPAEAAKIVLMTDPPEAGDEPHYRLLAKPFNNEQLFAEIDGK